MRVREISILTLVLPLLASCGSSWDIRKGDKLPIGCDESYYYQDSDGDGWGDSNSEPQKLCSADVDQGLTASNGRDCDDSSVAITGLVGTTCPAGMVGTPDGLPAPHGGFVFAESEFAWVYGSDAPVVRHAAATRACEGWSASDFEGGDWMPSGHLATFAALEEINNLQQEIASGMQTGDVYAGFLGIAWDGSSIDSGTWAWVDDSDPALIAQGFTWCEGVPPSPADFFPLLNPDDPDHVPAMNAQLPELRLAWVRQESGDWCLGLPWNAIPDDIWADLQAGTANLGDPFVVDVSRYTTSDAHLVCKRPVPDPEDYRHLVGAGDE